MSRVVELLFIVQMISKSGGQRLRVRRHSGWLAELAFDPAPGLCKRCLAATTPRFDFVMPIGGFSRSFKPGIAAQAVLGPLGNKTCHLQSSTFCADTKAGNSAPLDSLRCCLAWLRNSVEIWEDSACNRNIFWKLGVVCRFQSCLKSEFCFKFLLASFSELFTHFSLFSLTGHVPKVVMYHCRFVLALILVINHYQPLTINHYQ